MAVAGWICVGVAAWFLVSCAVGLLIGAVIGSADAEQARTRTEEAMAPAERPGLRRRRSLAATARARRDRRSPAGRPVVDPLDVLDRSASR
jgi:hypothetical protein